MPCYESWGDLASACDGTSRREVLRAGGLSLFGSMTLPRLLQAAAHGPAKPSGRARSIILVNLFGGPSHLDMFDMKPDAPRGPRRVPADRHQRAGPSDLRAHAAARPLDAQGDADSVGLAHLQQPQPVRRLDRIHGGRRPRELLHQAERPPGDLGRLSVPRHRPARPARLCLSAGPARIQPGTSPRRPVWRIPGPVNTIRSSPTATRNFPANSTRINRSTIPSRRTASRVFPSLESAPELTIDRFRRRTSLLGEVDRQLAGLERSRNLATMDHFQRKAIELLTSSRAPRGVRLVGGARRDAANATANHSSARACWSRAGWSKPA